MTTTVLATAVQRPAWADLGLVRSVRAELSIRPPLVDAGGVRRFAGVLAAVAARDAVVVHGGDCAERFADATPHAVRAKAGQLDSLAGLVTEATGLPAVRLGRLAGQYAKPRSSDREELADGTTVPSYRGDAVNGPASTDREPDPARLLHAYDSARRTLAELARLNTGRADLSRIYTSHEALLLDYEVPLLRTSPDVAVSDVDFASSAHFLWVGDRTRDPSGPHVEFAARVANGVGVKVGPSMSPDEAVLLSRRLNPHGLPGRVVFIVRLGAGLVDRVLPDLVARVSQAGAPVVWFCDPMHANTVRTASGMKTRLLPAILAETESFVRTVRAGGQWPGGVHLELTPDDVVECVPAATEPVVLRYRSACDPRLNPAQATDVVRRFTELL
ncbi:3-deoxy-7-phosphoheptulonate synthase [Actinophytocola sp.]|uniref:3-deoxy-7-phosphoheptulonate synthase n=1 Tax=Actinophytocola sp. TaxID=1872138 RepID=UPI003D6B41D4